MKVIKLNKLSKKVDADVEVVGSKSITNRALIIGAVSSNPVKIYNPSDSEDSMLLRAALQKIGIKIIDNNDHWIVENSVVDLSPGEYEIDFGLAGAPSRFFMALAAFVPGLSVTVTGNDRLQQRPMSDLFEALESLGASLQYLGKDGFLPVRINGVQASSEPSEVQIDVSKSSQFMSALMLVSPLFKAGLEVLPTGQQVSKSYSSLTKNIIRQADSGEVRVEADAAAAGYAWAIAVLSGGKVTVKNIFADSSQGEFEILNIFEAMGAKIEHKDDSVTVFGPLEIKPINVDMSNCPDSAQTIAVVAAFAKGESVITGLSTLPNKETDRLAAIQDQLAKMGVKSETTSDSITIYGGFPNVAQIRTYHDHRMAMAFSLACVKIDAIKIENPEVVNKSFPKFWQMLKKIGVEFSYE
jgi:3-phosphoshikimate 1-carboxyvinyltransferase